MRGLEAWEIEAALSPSVVAMAFSVNATSLPDLPLAFFTWHDRLEDQHKAHVWDELKACYDSPRFHEEPFLAAGVRMLNGVQVFWDGLNEARLHGAYLSIGNLRDRLLIL